MKTAREIELWALEILERVAHGDFHEDSLVELKRELPDPYKTARRIAGHCNAARGETVLWIIGVDENAGVTGRHPVDLANTLPSIWQHFESEPPESCEVSIGFSDTACTALAFSALRVPYMVKNPSFGREAGHVIESEIPWRDGTRIRTARRDEVLRLLIDYSHSPQVECPRVLRIEAFLRWSWSWPVIGRTTAGIGPRTGSLLAATALLTTRRRRSALSTKRNRRRKDNAG